MFGGTGFMLDGKLAAAVSKRGLLLRVGKDRYREALAWPGARPMEMRGRTMEGYVYIDPPVPTNEALKAGNVQRQCQSTMSREGRACFGSLPPHTGLGKDVWRSGRLVPPESGGRWALIQAFAAEGPLSQTSCGALAKTSS